MSEVIAQVAMGAATTLVAEVTREYVRDIRTRFKETSQLRHEIRPYVSAMFGETIPNSQVLIPVKKNTKDRIAIHGHHDRITLASARKAENAVTVYLLGTHFDKIRKIISRPRIDLSRNLFTIGSPNANDIADNQFAEWNATLPLRWVFVPPKRDKEKIFRLSGGMRYGLRDWKIYDRVKKRTLEIQSELDPRPDKDRGPDQPEGEYHFMKTDYLLITKGPNTLRPEHLAAHVSFAGLHGVGTRATQNFLTNPEWLKTMAANVHEKGRYYQVLLPIKSIDHDLKTGDSNPLEFGEPMFHSLRIK